MPDSEKPERRALTVCESTLIGHVEPFESYGYSRAVVRYPRGLHGVTVPTNGEHLTNCCCFVEALVVGAFQHEHGEAAKWSPRLHRLAMVATKDRFGPVTAFTEAGFGNEVALGSKPPPPWTVCQGWRPDGGGHTFIVVRADGDRVLVLEANDTAELDGVGWRHMGLLRYFGVDPAEQVVTTPWIAVLRQYSAGLRGVALNVEVGS